MHVLELFLVWKKYFSLFLNCLFISQFLRFQKLDKIWCFLTFFRLQGGSAVFEMTLCFCYFLSYKSAGFRWSILSYASLEPFHLHIIANQHTYCLYAKANLHLGSRFEKEDVDTNKPKQSHFKNVRWSKRSDKWKAALTLNKKKHDLGSFENESEAARAVNELCRKLKIPLRNPEVEHEIQSNNTERSKSSQTPPTTVTHIHSPPTHSITSLQLWSKLKHKPYDFTKFDIHHFLASLKFVNFLFESKKKNPEVSNKPAKVKVNNQYNYCLYIKNWRWLFHHCTVGKKYVFCPPHSEASIGRMIKLFGLRRVQTSSSKTSMLGYTCVEHVINTHWVKVKNIFTRKINAFWQFFHF